MYEFAVERLYLQETGADHDEQDNQLTADEKHDCCSLHETLLQNGLIMAVCRSLSTILEEKFRVNVIVEENNRNVVVVEDESNRNVVVVVVVVVKESSRNEVVLEENYRILWASNLYKCSTSYLFLSLHSAPEELTWFGSAPFAENRLVKRIACKGT